LSTDLVGLIKNIADIVYKELPYKDETRKKEIAQRIAIEIADKVCSETTSVIPPYQLESELWLEYDVLLTQKNREVFYNLVLNGRKKK